MLEEKYGGKDRLRTVKTAKLTNLPQLKGLKYDQIKDFRNSLRSLVDFCRLHDPQALTQVGHAYAINAKTVMGPIPMLQYLRWLPSQLPTPREDNLESALLWIEDLCSMAEKVDIVHSTLPKTTTKKEAKASAPAAATKKAAATSLMTQEDEPFQDDDFMEELLFHVEEQQPSSDNGNPQDQPSVDKNQLGQKLLTYLVQNAGAILKPAEVSKPATPIKAETKPPQVSSNYRGNSPNRRNFSPSRSYNNQRPYSPGRNANPQNRSYSPNNQVRQGQTANNNSQQQRSSSPSTIFSKPENSSASATSKPEFKWHYKRGECSFCGVIDQHAPPECSLYLTLTKEAKWEAVSNRRLCYHLPKIWTWGKNL
jgi:hypothetical protein